MSDEITNTNLDEFARFSGRSVIYTTYESVGRENVVSAISDVKALFQKNKSEILFLQRYFRGIQPILHRTKEVRPEICNKVVDNWANLIVRFKDGYLLGDPIQYVTRRMSGSINEKGEKVQAGVKDKNKMRDVELLNEIMEEADKDYYDKKLCNTSHICGTSFRMIMPQKNQEDGVIKIIDAEPENTCVVYSSDIGHEPVFAIYRTEAVNENGTRSLDRYNCYTKDSLFVVENDKIVSEKENSLGFIPIVEYPNNAHRIGEFEIVLSLLDLLNKINSNRADGVEQFVQSYLKIINADISREDFLNFQKMGAIKINDVSPDKKSDVDYITQQLDQTQTETLVASIKSDILAITGIPNRNGGSSTSDTGSAVVMRDGWSDAETRAKSREVMISKSEKLFIKYALKIINDCKYSVGKTLKIKPKDIDIKFTRRNYENITQKSTVLTQMLGSDKIHPRYAFEYCGLFNDPEIAYIESEEYVEKQRAKMIVDTKKNNSKLPTDVKKESEKTSQEDEKRLDKEEK